MDCIKMLNKKEKYEEELRHTTNPAIIQRLEQKIKRAIGLLEANGCAGVT